MKHITYTCDRCGKKTNNAGGVPIAGLEEVDLCCECSQKLQRVVKNWLTSEITTNSEEPKQIDDGKIKALRDAGWTTKAIAEEIGCSKPTIINHLKAMGIEKGVEA